MRDEDREKLKEKERERNRELCESPSEIIRAI